MSSQLYKLSTYKAPITFLLSRYIREYDLHRANISILLQKGIITKDQYSFYNSMDRVQRQISIGMMQKDENISKAVSDGFIEARQMFMEYNNLNDVDILSIKKDAIYVIDKVPMSTVFDNLRFICKNTYTSYYLIDNKEFYYFLDQTTGDESLDVKGISDEALELHKFGMMTALREIFFTAQTKPINEVLILIKKISDDYLLRNLPIDFYREFNSTSRYKVMFKEGSNKLYNASIDTYVDYATNTMPIDITFNHYLLCELYKIFSTMYFIRN